jgi:hypothetical protein
VVLNAQQEQQRMLSDQAAENSARQFNATSENQVNQFNTNLAATMNQFNATQSNAMSQFNVSQQNSMKAQNANRTADINKFNATMANDINKFNANISFQRDSWNATNAAAVEASNVAWRRRANELDTATENAVNMQNSMNAYNMTQQANAFLWQEMRDQADHEFKAYEGDQARRASIIVAALGQDADAYKRDKTGMYLSSAISKALFSL